MQSNEYPVREFQGRRCFYASAKAAPAARSARADMPTEVADEALVEAAAALEPVFVATADELLPLRDPDAAEPVLAAPDDAAAAEVTRADDAA